MALAFAIFSFDSFSKDNLADFNKNSFYRSNRIMQYLLVGGGYKSDYNSNEYEILAGYKYKSKKFIHEIDFLHEVTHTSTTRKPLLKTEELYDFEASSRMMLPDSKNYLNSYGRIQYDEWSDFYYDHAVATGLGRVFNDGKLESSINLGYNDIKDSNSEIILMGIIRGKINLTDKISMSTRALITRAEKDYDEEYKNVLSFKIEKNLSFQLVHKYERNRYVKTSSSKGTYRVNRVKREAYARIKYSF